MISYKICVFFFFIHFGCACLFDYNIKHADRAFVVCQPHDDLNRPIQVQYLNWEDKHALLLDAFRKEHADKASVLKVIQRHAIDCSDTDAACNTHLHRFLGADQATIEQIKLYFTISEDCVIDINRKNQDGDTPLYIAVNKIEDINIALVQLLLEYGEDPTILNNMGRNPIACATQHGHESIVVLFINHVRTSLSEEEYRMACRIVLNEAVYYGHIGIIDHFVNDTTQYAGIDNNTMLFDAFSNAVNYSFSNWQHVVQKAIAYRLLPRFIQMRPEYINEKRGGICNITALRYAINGRNVDIIASLLEQLKMSERSPELINTVDRNGCGAFHWVALLKDQSKTFLILPLLLSVDGININLQNKNGHTGLHLATIKRRLNFLLFFCSCAHAGLSIDIRNKDGRTALHLASMRGYSDVIEQLINYKDARWTSGTVTLIDVISIKDKDGYTALDYAKKYKHNNVVRLLTAIMAHSRQPYNTYNTCCSIL